MSETPLPTKNLTLVPRTRDETRTDIEQMPPEIRAEFSAAWLELLENSGPCDPWIHGFSMVHANSGEIVGQAGFKGPPDEHGVVEIAYGVAPEHQGRGYATEAAAALASYALSHETVAIVRAHTLPQANASTRVLTKCGFQRIGEVLDPDDGLVWRWEKQCG